MYKNTHWYRLLQVVYGITLIASILVVVALIYQKYHPRPEPLSYEEFTTLRTESGGELSIMGGSGRTTGSWILVISYSLGALVLVLGIFFILRKLFFYISEGKMKKGNGDDAMQNIYDGFMSGKYSKIHNPAGLDGIDPSPSKYSVGDEVKDERIFRTIKLLPKGDYDCHEELGEAIVYYNRADVRPKPNNYAEGVQDTFGLLEALEAGRMSLCSKITEEFYSEAKKGIYRDKFEERYQYFFPDGTCFFDIRTKSITPSFRR